MMAAPRIRRDIVHLRPELPGVRDLSPEGEIRRPKT